MLGLRVGIDDVLLGDARGGKGGCWRWRRDFGERGFTEVVEDLERKEEEGRGT